MNKKAILLILIIFIVFGFIIYLGNPQRKNISLNKEVSAGFLSSLEKHFDFGTISMLKGKVEHSFVIKNENNYPVTIGKIYTSCMCTEASLIKNGKEFGPFGMPGHGFIPSINETLNPGEEAQIKVVFDPAAHGPAGIGKNNRRVFIQNESGKNILNLDISAYVTP